MVARLDGQCKLARSLRDALEVAREGSVADARSKRGRRVGVLGEEVRDWDFEAIFEDILLNFLS